MTRRGEMTVYPASSKLVGIALRKSCIFFGEFSFLNKDTSSLVKSNIFENKIKTYINIAFVDRKDGAVV